MRKEVSDDLLDGEEAFKVGETLVFVRGQLASASEVPER